MFDRAALVNLLLERKGCCFVGLTCQFDLNQNKKMYTKDNPFLQNKVVKVVDCTLLVNFDYDKALQNRSDGTESATDGPTWQQRVVLNNSTRGLTIGDSGVYICGELRSQNERFFVDGVEISKDDIKEFLRERQRSQLVNWKTIKIDNITRITIDGETYSVLH